MFYHILQTGIVNAYIIHKDYSGVRKKAAMSHKDFRRKLAYQLAEASMNRYAKNMPTASTAPSSVTRLHFSSDSKHLPAFVSQKGMCSICKRSSCRTKCPTCNLLYCTSSDNQTTCYVAAHTFPDETMIPQYQKSRAKAQEIRKNSKNKRQKT